MPSFKGLTLCSRLSVLESNKCHNKCKCYRELFVHPRLCLEPPRAVPIVAQINDHKDAVIQAKLRDNALPKGEHRPDDQDEVIRLFERIEWAQK